MRFVDRRGLTRWWLLIVAVAALAACRATPPATPAPAGPISRAVYLYNSAACECERDRNEVAEGTMANVAAAHSSVRRVEKIDVARQPGELERYEKLTRFGFMPVLLGLDANDRVAQKIEGFFEEKAVAELLAGSGGAPR